MKKLGMIFSILVALQLFGCATGGVKSSQRWTAKKVDSTKLAKFDVPIVVNDRVVAWIDYFQGVGRNYFARYLARSGKYVPQMRETLKKYALPQDLVYIALIESGFSYKAYSRAHAVGPWQFIRGTGKRYGLNISNWVDERRAAEKATVAAAKYFRDLFDEFGDWHLAMAAYNAGEGKIAKAIKKTGTRNFWEMLERDRRYLRAETKDYVPKFIAATIIAKSPERFGFTNIEYDKPLEKETSVVETQTDLAVVARCADLPVEIVEEYNPELTRGSTPPDVRNYVINLPVGTVKKFEVAYAKVPESERIMIARHIVRHGDTAGKIARRYGISVKELLAANDLRNSSSLKRGSSLIIPIGGATKTSVRNIVAEEDGKPRGGVIKHRVKGGETLGLIAQNYGVSVYNIKRWNKLKRNLIHKGQVIRIYGVEDMAAVAEASQVGSAVSGGEVSYKVKKGDSLWTIAKKYGVKIDAIKGWNPTVTQANLKAGQKIKLFASKETIPLVNEIVSMNSPAVSSSVSDKLQEPNQTLTVAEQNSASDLLKMETKGPLKNNPVPTSVSYHIKSGDTLWDIAQKYSVSVKDIISWNNLGDKNHKRLKPGDIITIKTR